MVSIRRRRPVVVSAGRTVFIQVSKLKHLDKSQDGSQVSFTDVVLKKRKPHRRKVNNPELNALRGVYFKNMKWQAAIKVGKKQVHLGTVASKEDAAHLYDRAAYMCGREPNFALSLEVKRELDTLEWDEFLANTRKEIANKKLQKRLENQNRSSPPQAGATSVTSVAFATATTGATAPTTTGATAPATTAGWGAAATAAATATAVRAPGTETCKLSQESISNIGES